MDPAASGLEGSLATWPLNSVMTFNEVALALGRAYAARWARLNVATTSDEQRAAAKRSAAAFVRGERADRGAP